MNTNQPVAQSKLGPDQPRWIEVLRDNTKVGIRPISKRDGAEERAFIEALSPEARRYHFLGQLGHPTSELITQFTSIDYNHEVAFAAVIPDGTNEKILGISRYNTSTDGSSCECAVTVLDAWHHKGLGTVLMKHLIEVARSRGILYMFSIDSAANVDMTELAKYLGFTARTDPGDPTQTMHSLWL